MLITFQTDHFSILLFILMSLLLSLGLFSFTKLINKGTNILDNEKLTTYECGFDPIKDIFQPIDISFYKIAVLYILFDLEIIILLPLLTTFNWLNFDNICYLHYFIFVLWLGLIFELKSEILK